MSDWGSNGRRFKTYQPDPAERGLNGCVSAGAGDGRLRGVEGVCPHHAVRRARLLSFTEALWEETRGSGVRILALCPGATETRFFEAAGTDFMTQGRQTPEHVAAVRLRAFDSGRGPSVVSGVANRMLASGYRIMPRAAMVAAGTKECAPCAYITTLSDDGRWLAKGRQQSSCGLRDYQRDNTVR